MSIVIRWRATNSRLDGVTNFSALANYERDPADDNTIVCDLPDGTNLGRLNLVEAFQHLQRPPPLGLGPQIVAKSSALQRNYGVAFDDFFLAQGVLVPTGGVLAATPEIFQAERGGTPRDVPFSVVATNTGNGVQVLCDADGQPSLIKTSQEIVFAEAQPEPPLTLELTLYLIPLDDPQSYVTQCTAGGGGGGLVLGTFVQEEIAAQKVLNVDATLAAGLSFPPVSSASVGLFLNGVQLDQGPGDDYELQGATLQDIRWLAGTGTAPNLQLNDLIVAWYVR